MLHGLIEMLGCGSGSVHQKAQVILIDAVKQRRRAAEEHLSKEAGFSGTSGSVRRRLLEG